MPLFVYANPPTHVYLIPSRQTNLPFGVRRKMTIKIIGVILLFSFGCALSQYNSVYLGSNNPDATYDKTRQEIITNFLNNKPLLNYIPVYNTDYGHWNGEPQKVEEDPLKKPQTCEFPKQDLDFQKLSQVITRLKTDMQNLSHKTKHVYEDKLKELNEVKKVNENLKLAMQNTDVLKNSLHQNEKELTELTKNGQNPNGYQIVNSAGVEQFLKMIESLESMVRNINYEKLGM